MNVLRSEVCGLTRGRGRSHGRATQAPLENRRIHVMLEPSDHARRELSASGRPAILLVALTAVTGGSSCLDAPPETPATELGVDPSRVHVEALWPDGAPGALGDSSEDQPRLIVYLPEPADATGTGVIVVPGGGYEHLAMDHEGHQVRVGWSTGAWRRSYSAIASVLDTGIRPRRTMRGEPSDSFGATPDGSGYASTASGCGAFRPEATSPASPRSIGSHARRGRPTPSIA